MSIAREHPDILAAPERLVAETRLAFRRTAIEHVERAVHESMVRICVDLAATKDIDASGLGVLVLVQKRARERMIATRLLNAGPAVRQMLVLTRLDYLFELDD
ncbi:MAG: STAS domain-containing protein [Gemmatimonadetes bacterium]|nr:STAS domain-containing protein [Gemmatimonadota bacterium]